MTDFLFDAPIWLPAILLAIGVFLLIRGNTRQISGMRNAGAAVILLAILWTVLSFVIDTPRKICERMTAQAVQAVADRDWNAFDATLSPEADARFVNRPWRAQGRPAVDAAARMVATNSGLHSASIRRVRSSAHDATRTVAFTAYANTDLTSGYPIDSDWEFDFREQAGKWLIQEMRVSRVDNTEPEGIRESLNKR